MTKAMSFLIFGNIILRALVPHRLQNLAQEKVNMIKLGLLKVCMK